LLLALEGSSFAQASTSDQAREELKKGYELKKAGHCDEAVVHLQESVRLDPELKALANLAECEGELGKLVIARTHWRSVQQLAAVGSNAAIEADAQKHVADLDARVATVTVHVGVDAPDDTRVTLDDAVLASADLAGPIPLDPGKHVLVARAAGREPGTVSLEVAEGQKKEIVVRPGAAGSALAPAATPASLSATQAAPEQPPPPPSAPESSSPWKTIGLVTAGAGVVGLGVGAVFGLKAMSDKSSAACAGTTCPNAGAASELASAQSAGTTSTIFFVAGGALAAAGATMWFLAPSGVQLSPAVGLNGAGATLRARW
jgi:tetratricopeptide (TPR) repeat protein